MSVQPLSSASTLHLPSGPWTTVLDCLCAHFAAISREVWVERMARGRVLDAHGMPIGPDHPYREGMGVRYFRELSAEKVIPFEASLLYADRHLVVADKPHFLPVTPAGEFVEQTLLRRLIAQLDNPDLVPLHRIDRGTAGLVMFSARPESRAAYQALFRDRRIEKHYEAIAPALPDQLFPMVRRTRMVAGEPFFRMQEVEGQANTETRVELSERRGERARYALYPLTGKKHQLRVHMAALGAPILNDGFYPILTERADDDYSRPLQLLARTLVFIDPFDGINRRFETKLHLNW